jgi:hypothetical protein
MSAFPYFSDIASYATSTISSRKDKLVTSKLNAWVRVSSGTGGGLSLISNPNLDLFKAAGIYGSQSQAGAVGLSWGGGAVLAGAGQPFRPSPIVTSLEVDEGAGNLSRKAEFSITCFSKGQMEVLTKYFLEPGHSVFIEWGWNTGSGVGGLQGLSGANIAKFQSFKNTNDVRAKTNGHYDNYLGFMTGGGLSISGDTWIINVKCTGYTELPSYLVTTENGEQESSTNPGVLIVSEPYGQDFIENATPARQRWMYAFNNLPDTRRYERIKWLGESGGKLDDTANFVNFDPELIEELNGKTEGTEILGFELFKSKVTINGTAVELPFGTKLASEDGYIRFKALMEIISSIGFLGYKLGNGKTIKFKINSSNTYCSSFKNIYSVDPSKLFIPNPNTPTFNLSSVSYKSKITDIVSTTKPIDNTVRGSKSTVVFPEQGSITYTPKIGTTITKGAFEGGKLDNLYVNFNFAKGILETKNFFIKDALYQILNGLSSAVNGTWDFQITENEADGVTELTIHELNFISNNSVKKPYQFSMVGENSVFIDASFDLDISGAKMNQIIGQKLGSSLNSDSKPTGLFSAMSDQIALKLEKAPAVSGKVASMTAEDKANAKEEFLNIVLGKVSYAPRVEIEDPSQITKNIDEVCYLLGFKESSIFSALRLTGKVEGNTGQASPLMPINFTFKVHGVSGIKRGDKFTVDGIPSQYKDGFFQVLSVKHSVEGMQWYTEVTGGYRNRIK